MRKFQQVGGLLFILILSSFQMLGQNAQNDRSRATPTKLVGKIVSDDSGDALEYATITLTSVRDNNVITGGISDNSGKFELSISPGVYSARIEFISYQKFQISEIKIDPDEAIHDLGIIKLEPEATDLSEIEVRAEKSSVQMTLDKRVFNVGKDLASSGGSAADILDNVPSVTVDLDGNVSLRGNQNVRILVDGKPSGLIGVGDTDGLRAIPGNLIDKIEVITNPSARYEAEGMTGLINIVLKKTNRSGLNGAFDFSVGYPHNYGTAFNLNYRKKSINFFANYGVSYRKNPGGGSSYQERYVGDTTFIYTRDRDHERGGLSNSLKLGADIFVNPYNTITGSFLYRRSKEDNFVDLTYKDYFNSIENPTAISYRTDDEIEREKTLEYSVNYKRAFKRKGHELKADIQFEENTESEASDLLETYFTSENIPSGTPDAVQRSSNKEGEKRWLFQLDYIHPFSKEGKFEAGSRITLRDITNDYLAEQFDGDQWNVLDGLSNDFVYDENIFATYLIYGNKHNKFSYQLGLRAEYSDVRTDLLTTAEVNDRNYFDLFPSAHFTYDLGDDNAVQLSYSRRINRPRFWYLNPFFSFSDSRSFFTGNPDLDPEYTHSGEVGHIKYWDKGSISSSIYYRHTTGKIERITRVDIEGFYYTQPENLATEDAFGVEFTFSYNPISWWKMDGDINLFHAKTDGANLANDLKSEANSFFCRYSSRVTLWKKLEWQTRLNYRAPTTDTQGKNKAMGFVDLGFSTDIFNNNGTLTLSVSDIFDTRKRRYISSGSNFFLEGDWRRRSRQVVLSLNYRLNQKKRQGRGREDGFEGDDGF